MPHQHPLIAPHAKTRMDADTDVHGDPATHRLAAAGLAPRTATPNSPSPCLPSTTAAPLSPLSTTTDSSWAPATTPVTRHFPQIPIPVIATTSCFPRNPDTPNTHSGTNRRNYGHHATTNGHHPKPPPLHGRDGKSAACATTIRSWSSQPEGHFTTPSNCSTSTTATSGTPSWSKAWASRRRPLERG
jgi:hypothetical protein